MIELGNPTNLGNIVTTKGNSCVAGMFSKSEVVSEPVNIESVREELRDEVRAEVMSGLTIYKDMQGIHELTYQVIQDIKEGKRIQKGKILKTLEEILRLSNQ